MAIGKLLLKLGIDTTNLDKELGRVEKSMSKFGNSMKNVGTTLSQSLTLPIVGLGAASLKAFAEMEKLEKGMTAIMGSSNLAKEEIISLREVAKLPGLGLKEAVQGSVNLQAVGLSAKEAKETLLGFGTALAATGKGKENLDAIQYQLTQMISKNKILAEDYKVIQSNLPLMAEGLKAAFGTDNIDLIRATNIDAKDFILQLSKALKLLPETQNVTGGLANSFENLSDNIFISLNELGKTINESLKLEVVFDNVSKKMEELVNRFKSLTPEQQANIVKFALITAAVGPVILILGQLASSISSIITLSRTLISTFTILSGGTYLLVAAIGSLVAYYATTNEGQKSLSKTGALLSGSFERLKAAFSKTLELLGKLQPLFDLLLLVFGKIAVISFEIVLSQINAILSSINFVYDGVVKVITALGLLNKTTVEPKINLGFGGGSAGKPSGAGGSWGEETKKTTVTTDSPEVAAMKAKIKALEDSLVNSNKTKKQPKFDKKLFEFNEFKTLNDLAKAKQELEKLVVSDVAPKLREQIGLTENGLATMKNAAKDVLAFGQRLKENPPEIAKPFSDADAAAILLEEKIARLKLAFEDFNLGLQDIINSTLNDLAFALGEQLGNALSGAGFSLKGFIGPLADALGQVGKLAVQTGIAAAGIKLALKPPINPAVAIAGGVALIALSKMVKNKLETPALAEGGLATGPTMAMVGDNRNARIDPEVIAPLSKLKSMMGDMGVGGTLETKISGNDLIILLNRSQKGLSRIQ